MEENEKTARSARSEKRPAQASQGESGPGPREERSAAGPLIWIVVFFVGFLVLAYFFM